MQLPYTPQLDGLRGVSVLAVIFFHLNYRWADGGYLGVEAFFVVSGYLITSLLLLEFAYKRRISLRQFWARRARRLLPILYVLLGVTVLLSLLFARDYLGQLRIDVLAALAYVTNWHLIRDGQAYFEAIERQSPLLHLWSLAIEEQFYLLWPILLGWLLKKRSRKRAIIVTAIIIIITQLLSFRYAVLYSIDRAYYGTDSRLTGLLIGSLAAVLVPLHELGRYKSSLARPIKRVVGWLGWVSVVAVLGLMSLISPGSRWPYLGGFIIFDIAVILLCLSLMVDTRSWLSRLFSGKLFVWLGQRSYGLYLWHWVIFQFTRPGVDTVLIGWQNTGLRLILTVVITELSYQLVESVFRRRLPPRQLWRLPVVSGFTAALLCVSILFVTRPTVLAGQWPTREQEALNLQRQGELGGVEQAQIVSGDSQSKLTNTDEPAALNRPNGVVTIIGDSVVLGAAKSIASDVGKPLVLDAKVSRFPDELVNELTQLDVDKKLGPTVVIAVGTNGLITEAIIEETMSSLQDKQVVWVTPRGQRSWIRDSISNLRKLVPTYSNAIIADWAKTSADKPKWFVSDGVHVSVSGAEALAKLVADSIKQ